MRVIMVLLAGCTGDPTTPTGDTQVSVPPVQPPPERGPCEPLQVGAGDWRVSEAANLCLSFNAIEGDLIVDGDADVVECLCTIGGAIRVEGGVGSVSLPNLTELGGGIIADSQAITGLSLPALAAVPGAIVLRGDDRLADLQLDALATAGKVTFSGLAAEVVSLPALTTVETLDISQNLSLTTVDLPALASVTGSLVVRGNPDLGGVSGLDALASVTGDLVFDDDDELGALTGFPALTSVGGDLVLTASDQLAVVDGFGALTSVGGDLWLGDLGNLGSVTGFQGLTAVGGDLVVEDAPVLGVLDAFGSLGSVGVLRLAYDGVLTAVPSMPALQAAVAVELVDLDAVTEAPPFPALSSLERLVAQDLLRAEALPALPGVAEPTDVVVEGNSRLRDLTGLDAVTVVRGSLTVRSNLGLTTLGGLEALTVVDGDLVIEGNADLVDLAALAALTDIGGALIVRDNPSLPTSLVDALVDQLGVDHIGGAIDTTNNGAG